MRRLIIAFLLAALLPALQARAEQSRDFGEYTVHYIAVNSSFLNPDIAQQYGIVRGARRAFLNIAVQDAAGKAVAATVQGVKANMLRQSEEIAFIEVREGEALYYLGQFEFSNAETLRFELEILPQGESEALELKWDTRLYIN